MRTSSKGAVYLAHSSETTPQKRLNRSPVRAVLLTLVAFLTVLFSTPLISHTSEAPSTQASALRIACGDDLGSNMGEKKPWSIPLINSNFPAEDKTNRQMTGQEVFGWTTFFVSYKGETDDAENDSWTQKEERSIDIDALTKDNDDGNGGKDSAERIYDERTLPNCWFGSIVLNGANNVFLLSQLMTAVTSSFATFAFSDNLICDTPSANHNLADDNCIDLLFIIGGDGGTANQGLIGALTSSLYMPLIVLVALMVGVWVFYRGIVQRRLREGLFGVLWAILAVIAGLALLLNPAMLAKAPIAVNNTLAGCVISAFGGNNCVGGSGAGVIDDPTGVNSDKICVADANTNDPSESLQLISTSLTCSIWKAFVLEPYSQASFGTSFLNLDTNGGRGKELAQNAGRSPKEFCVDMRSAAPIGPQKGKTLNLNSAPICNIALYQLMLMTDVDADAGQKVGDDPTNNTKMDSGSQVVDGRWFKLIDVASSSDSTWNTWAGGTGSAFSKLGTAWITLFAAVCGGIVIVAISIFAVLFYLSSVLLMAFAPIFFLIGVHPGKGRDILKGYGEMVLSQIFKFVASAIFLLVALALYGGVLGATSSPGMTLLMVIVISLALFIYRREIVDLIGTVNMGGIQAGKDMSQKVFSKFGLKNDSDLRRLGTMAVGTAVGAKLAGGSIKDGAAEGFSRELKRTGGLLGRYGSGAAVGYDMVGADNKGKLRAEGTELNKKASDARDEAKAANDEYKNARGEYNDEANALNKLNEELKQLRETIDKDDSRDKVLASIGSRGTSGANFVEAMHTGTRIQETLREIRTVEAGGGDATAQRRRLGDLEARRNDLVNSIPTDDLKNFNAEYTRSTANLTKAVEDFRAGMAERATRTQNVAELQDRMHAARGRAVSTERDASALSASAAEFDSALNSFRGNHAITGGDMAKVRDAAQSGESQDRANPIQGIQDRARGEADLRSVPITEGGLADLAEPLERQDQNSIAGLVIPEQPAPVEREERTNQPAPQIPLTERPTVQPTPDTRTPGVIDGGQDELPLPSGGGGLPTAPASSSQPPAAPQAAAPSPAALTPEIREAIQREATKLLSSDSALRRELSEAFVKEEFGSGNVRDLQEGFKREAARLREDAAKLDNALERGKKEELARYIDDAAAGRNGRKMSDFEGVWQGRDDD